MAAQFAVLITVSLLVLVSCRTLRTGGESDCRCVPDQWQGILSSLEREFDLEGGRTVGNENNIYVYYDFTNKKFAMRELGSGSLAIADYEAGYKYVIQAGYCQGFAIQEPMTQMCLPENAELKGDFFLGDDVPVSIWQFDAPYNLTMKTTVIQKRCVPVSEEVFIQQGAYASVTSSLYLDVELGIKDPSVFQAPESCIMDTNYAHSNGMKRKRSRDHEDLLKALRNRFYIYN